MKSIISSTLLRRSGMFLCLVMLAITPLCAWSIAAPTPTEEETIAEKMQELQESEERWIQIDLAKQRLIAWEGGKPVYAVIISTGKKSTPTRIGTFEILSKHRSDRMRGSDYDVPDVPYTMYYYGGYAIHGAYWHRRFGTPVSHGCINVAVNHAKWLFNWAEVGTPVIVHE
jgi:lipoprotein-anchoring transpeptidase ErfK/SrfK